MLECRGIRNLFSNDLGVRRCEREREREKRDERRKERERSEERGA